MKSVVLSVLVGLFLLKVFTPPRADAIKLDSIPQNEINRLFHAQETIGGNITLTSNSTLDTGGYAFVLSGKTNDGTAVAIKATHIKVLPFYTKEYECYKQLDATVDKACEKYGILFIYHSGDFLKYKTMAMTKLDSSLSSLMNKIGTFSLDSILIIFRDMIKTLKFLRSKGVINQDIKVNNIMTKGANVFLIDFNVCVAKESSDRSHWSKDPNVYSDMLSLLRTMSGLINIQMYCNADNILENHDRIGGKKHKMRKRILLQKIKYTELVEPYVQFCSEVVQAWHEQRLPKFDDLYKMFDDVLYTRRNRSERIVFDWLTPEERATAMTETILPIESIIIWEENAH